MNIRTFIILITDYLFILAAPQLASAQEKAHSRIASERMSRPITVSPSRAKRRCLSD